MHNIGLRLAKLRFPINQHISFLIYILLLIIVAIVSFAANFFPPIVSTDSARYMLSALVQSEAAILAIVVTLSLVAVQLTATSFSPRLIHLFQRTGSFWLLLVIYIISIFYGLYALNQIIDNSSRSIIVDIWNPISISFRLGIVAFIALVIHIWNTLELLKPSTIMKKLSYDITMKSIKSYQDNPRNYKDPFTPIMDIVTSSLDRNDQTTFSEGLYTIRERIIYIFEYDTPFEDNEQLNIINILNKHFNNFREVSEINNYAVGELILEMWIIGEKAIEKQLDYVFEVSFEYINDSLNRGIEYANDIIAESAVFGIEVLASKAIINVTNENFKKIVSSAIENLANSATKANEKALENTLFFIYRSLAEIIMEAPRDHFNDDVTTAIDCLESLIKADPNPKMKFKEISKEHMKYECKRSLGILYFYANRFDDAKRTLQEVTKFEGIDRSENKYGPLWYGDAWYILSRIFDASGDISSRDNAKAEAAYHGFEKRRMAAL